MKIAKHFLISGHVQGVYYRAETRKVAARLNLSGWIKNLPNGDVECFACGEDQEMTTFASWLQKGPPLAKVDRVEIQDGAVSDLSGFTIISTED